LSIQVVVNHITVKPKIISMVQIKMKDFLTSGGFCGERNDKRCLAPKEDEAGLRGGPIGLPII
jgi:hypothetical protein